MEIIEFKKMFGDIAKENEFQRAFEGWFKEFPEVIHVLDLQRSNFGKYYYLNVKLYIQGLFGNQYIKSKELVKTDVGDIFIRQPESYSHLFNLEISLEDNERKEGLKAMFKEFIVPFINKTNSKECIKTLHRKGDLFILPAVKEELGI